MKIIANIEHKSLLVDDVGVMIDNWSDIILPHGISTIIYDTETEKGTIVFSESTFPNMPISKEHYNSFVAPFIGKHNLEIVKKEIADTERLRIFNEEQATIKAAQQEAELQAAREKAEILNRINALEQRVGIVTTVSVKAG